MKIIKTPAVQEVSERICDKCQKPAVSHFKFTFGYGSDYDLEYIEMDFCNKCGKHLRNYLLSKFPTVKPKQYSF